MSETTFDPYATLGVPREADATRLRDAYRRLSRQHHPDRSEDPRATERMQRINRAWEIVSSPAGRAQYDAHAARGPRPATPHWAARERRSTQWAPPPQWSASTATARAHPPPPVTIDDGEAGPPWRAIPTILLLIVAAPFLLAALPFPFMALFVVIVIRSVARRVG